MNIEIGKCYEITPKWKKSVVETEYFSLDDGSKTVAVQTCWRGGTFRVTPQDEDEIEWLKTALEDDSELEPYDFDEFEFLDTWDGVSEDYHFTSNGAEWTDEQMESLQEAMEEDFASSVLEDAGYHSVDSELIIYNGIEAKEVDPAIY